LFNLLILFSSSNLLRGINNESEEEGISASRNSLQSLQIVGNLRHHFAEQL